MNLIEQAIDVALCAHEGQTDKGGKPYILHPLRVLAAVGHSASEDGQCAAVLHDVLEDCPAYHEEMLREAGFSPRTISLVRMLTRQEGETYDQFIDRVSHDRDAAWIKLCDLRDNMDLSRLSDLSDAKRHARYERYMRAAATLQAKWGFSRAN